MGRRVIGLGAGGHSKVLIELLRVATDFEIVGLLDPARELWGRQILGVPVLGDDEMLERLVQEGVSAAFMGVGSVGKANPRKRLFELILEVGLDPITAVHPHAYVAPSASLGQGTVVLSGAVVQTCSRVGNNVIINSGAIVEHDCCLGNHVHVASGAVLASTVVVGDDAHIGAGATVRQCIRIGEGATVGAGAVVVKDVDPGVVVVGVPARPIR